MVCLNSYLLACRPPLVYVWALKLLSCWSLLPLFCIPAVVPSGCLPWPSLLLPFLSLRWLTRLEFCCWFWVLVGLVCNVFWNLTGGLVLLNGATVLPVIPVPEPCPTPWARKLVPSSFFLEALKLLTSKGLGEIALLASVSFLGSRSFILSLPVLLLGCCYCASSFEVYWLLFRLTPPPETLLILLIWLLSGWNYWGGFVLNLKFFLFCTEAGIGGLWFWVTRSFYKSV